jgi:hypothetical protein
LVSDFGMKDNAAANAAFAVVAAAVLSAMLVLPTALFSDSEVEKETGQEWSKIYLFEPEVAQYQARDKRFDTFFNGYSAACAAVATLLTALSTFEHIPPIVVVPLAVLHTVLCIVAAPVAHNLHHESYMVSSDAASQLGVATASAILTGETHVSGVDTRIGAGPVVGHLLPFVVYAKHLSAYWHQ